MVRPGGSGNHVRWQVGHLLYFGSYTLSLLENGGDAYKELRHCFGPGSESSDDASRYPAVAELYDRLRNVHERERNLLSGLSDADLERVDGSGEGAEPVWNQVVFTCLHEFHHYGQIAAMRTQLGKDRAFG